VAAEAEFKTAASAGKATKNAAKKATLVSKSKLVFNATCFICV
jgi:cytochrome c5